MEYEINVARPTTERDVWATGVYSEFRHYFRVIVPYGSVKKVYEELKEKFPDCKINVTRWQTIGEQIDMDKFEH